MRNSVGELRAGRAHLARSNSFFAIPAAVFLFASAADAAPDASGSLAPSQMVGIQTQISQAIGAVDPSLTGADRRNAIEQSLQGLAQTEAGLGSDGIAEFVRDAIRDGVTPAIVLESAIRGSVQAGMPAATAIATTVRVSIGAGAPADEIAAETIVIGMRAHLSSTDVGSGLGAAAAQLEPTDPQDARAIGRIVGNDGTAAMRTAFASAVIANGGSQELAALGSGNPEVTGQYQGGNVGNNNNGEGNLGENLPPCASPSCT